VACVPTSRQEVMSAHPDPMALEARTWGSRANRFRLSQKGCGVHVSHVLLSELGWPPTAEDFPDRTRLPCSYSLTVRLVIVLQTIPPFPAIPLPSMQSRRVRHTLYSRHY
jgi:hypothetical protein